MKAVGSSCDDSDLVVESLYHSVGKSPPDIGDDVVEVLADGPCDLDEFGQTAVARPCQPVPQLGGHHVGLEAIQDGSEGLLQEIGSIHGSVVSL